MSLVSPNHATTGFTLLIQVAEQMEIDDNRDKGYIAVWMTNEEQKLYDQSKLTSLLLSKAGSHKCKVVFFLSGSEDLCRNTEWLLLANLKNA